MVDIYIRETKGNTHKEGVVLLQEILWRDYNVMPPTIIKYEPKGKPYIDNLPFYFNISNTKQYIVVGISDSVIGIDVEKKRDYKPLVAQKAFTKSELNIVEKSKDIGYMFTKLWTLKESYIKCNGKGLAYELKDIDIVIDNNGCITSNDSEVTFFSVDIEDITISVCLAKKCDKSPEYRVHFE